MNLKFVMEKMVSASMTARSDLRPSTDIQGMLDDSVPSNPEPGLPITDERVRPEASRSAGLTSSWSSRSGMDDDEDMVYCDDCARALAT